MFTYDPNDRAVGLTGHLWLEQLEEGFRPYRLTDWGVRRIPTPSMQTVVAACAGVRFRFTTTATRIGLRARVRPIAVLPDAHFPAVFDLLVDGEKTQTITIDDDYVALADDERGGSTRASARDLMFEALPAGCKKIEVWLPHTAIVDLLSVSANQPIHHLAEPGRPRWLHHGSSISHCLEAHGPTETWPAIAALTLGWDLTDMGFAGNAVLDSFVARAIAQQDVDFISIKIGINVVNGDLMRQRAFIPAIHGFIDAIRDGHPDTPILIISPISCPTHENTPGPTVVIDGAIASGAGSAPASDALTISAIRQILARIVSTRREAGEAIQYLDGRELFDNHDVIDGHLPDGLHPDAKGYRLMGQRFTDLSWVREMESRTLSNPREVK